MSLKIKLIWPNYYRKISIRPTLINFIRKGTSSYSINDLLKSYNCTGADENNYLCYINCCRKNDFGGSSEILLDWF